MNKPADDTKIRASVPRYALTVPEAAAALGMKEQFFRDHVLPELSVIPKGSIMFIACDELDRWAKAASTVKAK